MTRRLRAKRYVAPLREGGSLPAIIDTEPSGQFVVKFRGAGQGPKALVAEIIAAEIAELLDLPIPTAAIVELADGFGRGEPDPEIQDILRESSGANFGLAYLPGALGFNRTTDFESVDSSLASTLVWFDALLTNPDRTVRNPNLLVWDRRIWLIDHGASLYFHHRWDGWEQKATGEFPLIRDHILLARAGEIGEIDARFAPLLDELAAIRAVVAAVPDEWIVPDPLFADNTAQRDAYVTYFEKRLREPRAWVARVIDAHRHV